MEELDVGLNELQCLDFYSILKEKTFNPAIFGLLWILVYLQVYKCVTVYFFSSFCYDCLISLKSVIVKFVTLKMVNFCTSQTKKLSLAH